MQHKQSETAISRSRHPQINRSQSSNGKKEKRRGTTLCLVSSQSAEVANQKNKRRKKYDEEATSQVTVSTNGSFPRARKPPSHVALALSQELKDLSSRKRLKDALEVYWNSTNDSIRDGHHGSIMVDCCSRCGAVEEGEKIIASMKSSGTFVSIHAYTALLKGYSHSGQIKPALDLYKSMCLSKSATVHYIIFSFLSHSPFLWKL